ncbi:flagellar protein FlgN [Caldicellulosiruptoraceae bacterium PP1]
MYELLNKVLNLLMDEIGILKNILEIQNAKTKFIVENKVAYIVELNNKENIEVKRLNDIENSRYQYMNEISKIIDKDNINIDDLILLSDGDIKERLMKAKNDIEDVILKLKKVNEINQGLIKSSLEYIDFMVNLISSNQLETSYEKSGKNIDKSRSLFDIKL